MHDPKKGRPRALNAVSRVLSGSLVGQGILIAISPILTRIYSPADFTALAILTAFSSVLGSVATLTWEAAIVIPEDEQEARGLAWLGLFSTIALSGILTLIFWALRDVLARVFGLEVLSSLWWVVPVTVLSIGIHKVASAWFIRIQNYGKIAWRNLTQGIAQALFNLGLGLLGIAPFGLMGGLAAGRVSATFGMLGAKSGFSEPPPGLPILRQIIRRYKRFPLVTSWSYATSSLGLQLPALLLAAYYNAIEIGFVALTMRVLASPIGILSDAIRQYYEGRFGSILRSGGSGLRRIFIRTTSRLALLGLVPTAVILAIAPWLFGFVFGPEWVPAGDYARVLVVAYYFQLVVSPVSASLTILERQNLQLFWDITRAVLTAAVIILTWAFNGSLTIALLGFAVVQVCAYITLFVLSSGAISKHQNPAI